MVPSPRAGTRESTLQNTPAGVRSEARSAALEVSDQ